MPVFQNPTSGRVSNMDDVTLFASAARTTTSNGTGQAIGDKATLRLLLDITAVSGTSPTLVVTIETSVDNATWVALTPVPSAFASANSVSTQRRQVAGCDRYVRAVSTIGGTTPSFTFSLTGEAV